MPGVNIPPLVAILINFCVTLTELKDDHVIDKTWCVCAYVFLKEISISVGKSDGSPQGR